MHVGENQDNHGWAVGVVITAANCDVMFGNDVWEEVGRRIDEPAHGRRSLCMLKSDLAALC